MDYPSVPLQTAAYNRSHLLIAMDIHFSENIPIKTDRAVTNLNVTVIKIVISSTINFLKLRIQNIFCKLKNVHNNITGITRFFRPWNVQISNHLLSSHERDFT